LKRELKKQIRQDELVSGFEHAMVWIRAHRDEVRIGGFALVALLVIGGGLGYFVQNRRHQAEKAFSDALETFQAPVAGESSPDEPPPAGTQTFPTAKEKFQKAAAAFDGIERRFPSEPAARRARYFGALARIEVGDYTEAEKALKDAAAEKDANALEPSLARLALAELYVRSGQNDKAIDAYREIAGDAKASVGRDYALMSLGAALESAKRFAEASASYKRLTEEFPSSVYAAEARRRVDYLQSALEG
jgi:predicted negative regulator of RcsB-dependent stress response